MLDVDQNYGTPETPKPFPTFKDCVAQDVQNVIFNPNEFADCLLYTSDAADD